MRIRKGSHASAKKLSRNEHQASLPDITRTNQSVLGETQSASQLPPLHFPKGTKRISGEEAGVEMESMRPVESPLGKSRLMKTPLVNALQITDGSQTIQPRKMKRLPSLPKVPTLMASQAREHLLAKTLVSPKKTQPLLKKYDFSSTFVPMGPLPNRELLLQQRGPIALREEAATRTLSIMQAHEAKLGRQAAFEDPEPSSEIVVYGDDNDDKKKQAAIEGSVDVDELRTKEGKVPTPLDFIKCVQTDPEFANRFCYCDRDEESDFYDFKIVAFEMIDKDKKESGEKEEYMTVSSNGIVHNIKGETTFLTIPEWEREMRLFEKIKKISFFSNYRMWKTFSAWKTHMRRTSILTKSDILNKSLFILDKQLAVPLLEIRAQTLNISRMEMMKVNTESPLTLRTYNDEQRAKRDTLKTQISKVEVSITGTLKESCVSSMETFQQENRISISQNNDPNAEENEEAEPFLVGDQVHKSMPYTQEATTRTHYKRLTKYIRLIDYMVMDSKLQLIENTIQKSLNVVQADFSPEGRMRVKDRKQNPIFEIDIWFTPDREIKFEPDKFELRDAIKKAVTEGIQIVCSNELFLVSAEFEEYTSSRKDEFGDDKDIDEQNDLMSLALQQHNLLRNTSKMYETIENIFGEVMRYSEIYQSFVDFYHDNKDLDRSWNLDQKGGSQKQTVQKVNAETFREIIKKLQTQQEDVNELQEEHEIKIFKLNATKLRDEIKRSPAECLKKLKSYLPKLSYEGLDAICNRYIEVDKKLSRRAETVTEFCDIKKFLWEAQDKISEIRDQYAESYNLRIIMEENKIKIPEKNTSKEKECLQNFNSCNQKLTDSMDRVESTEVKFKRMLDRQVPELESAVAEMQKSLNANTLKSSTTNINDAVKLIEKLRPEIEELRAQSKRINDQQKFLEMSVTIFEDIDNTYFDFNLKSKLWIGSNDWQQIVVDWKKTVFSEIDKDEIMKKVDEYDKLASQCLMNLDKNEQADMFRQAVDEMKDTVPVVAYLRSTALETEHKEAINNLFDSPLEVENLDFTLQTMIDLDVKSKKDQIGEIALRAKKEQELQEQFKSIDASWKAMAFDLKSYKEDTYIVQSTESVDELLDESLVQLGNMLAARFSEKIEHNVVKFRKQLQYLQDFMDEWIKCQTSWTYLESIFESPDIKNHLQNEYKMFQQVDSSFKGFMNGTNQQNQVSRVYLNGSNMRVNKENNPFLIMQNNNKLLSQIEKELDKFLERKRMEYPRFFFLSNDELLLILAEGSRDPLSVQPHLRKCFENIAKIKIEPDEITREIVAVESAEGEILRIKKVATTGQQGVVEKWIAQLEENMKKAVTTELKRAYDATLEDEDGKKRTNWVQTQLSQAVCVISSLNWCFYTESLLDENAFDSLSYWFEENVTMLDQLTKLVRNNLTTVQRRAAVALITQDVHYRDIISELREEYVEDVNNFVWQKQLRYYEGDPQNVPNEFGNAFWIEIKQVNTSLDYACEFLGATTRLVITPLTDRCWMTITGALKMKLGAAPAGPAGTGKTESTKDLAKALGKFCVVFNCSDQINYLMMAKLFTGLCYTGAWACLDEFNRIDIEVLSVIAQQVLCMRNAMLMDRTSFFFLDKEVKLVSSLGIFITMNPGYKGRTELPDNLKVLFRPVSMMIPDYGLIAEIMLFAEGFQSAKLLSGKMVKLYKLSSEQLSQQHHYDFGMRAVKSVLVMAGSLKRSEPTVEEEVVLIRAMMASNIPKFLKDDVPLFNAIVQDLFPGVEIPSVPYADLQRALDATMVKQNYSPDETQFNKIIQFYETMNVRFGIMIIGETMSGKSRVYQSLKDAMNLLHKEGNALYPEVVSTQLNPKSISMAELYGDISVMTQEWTDGLAAQKLRTYAEMEGDFNRWVIFDGPVDALWIENMNTVLDDNMTLCLSNGERIKLKPEMKLIFECEELSQASPATVSRCGMVYSSPETCNWRLIVKRWLLSLNRKDYPDLVIVTLEQLFDTYLGEILNMIKLQPLVEPIPTVTNSQITSITRLIEAILGPKSSFSTVQLEDDQIRKSINRAFIMAVGWGIGGSVDHNSQPKFENALATDFSANDIPSGSIFDYKLVHQEDDISKFELWSNSKGSFEFNQEMSYFDMVVPTKDTVRFSWFTERAVLNKFPIFITGVTGVGKSIIIQSTLERLEKSGKFQEIFMSFSSQTSSKEVHNQLIDKLEKVKKNLYSGENSKRACIFIDDVNMPETDSCGTQMPIELLRQIVDYNGMYHRETREWSQLDNTTMICAAAPPGGGRKELTSRFTRHFNMICMPPTQGDSLSQIFRQIINGYLKTNNFKKEVCMMGTSVVDASTYIYDEISANLKPTPSKSHYTFNLRDISKIFQGILMANPNSVNSHDGLTELWIHETMRVFHDRLINEEDRLWVKKQIFQQVSENFKLKGEYEDYFNSENIVMFGDFIKFGLPLEDRKYDRIPSFDVLEKTMYKYIEAYNIDYPEQKMELVLFKEALGHLTRICRILRQERGNGLLVGVGGCGKQTLTRLASHISGCKINTLEMLKDYKQENFRDDIREAMKPCGIENKKITLVINDNQITDDIFLEDVNNILNSGEIPNLWEGEDRDYINNEIKPIALENGIQNNQYGFFVSRVRDNLHIVLCLSPVGDKLRKRLRMFPALVNCCTINWFDPWPEEALLSVSTQFVRKISTLEGADELQDSLAQACVFVHQSIKVEAEEFNQQLKRKVYVTPKSYLDLIGSYESFLNEKRQQLSHRRNTLQNGLKKLEETNKEVEVLQVDLKEKEPILAKKSVEMEEFQRKLEIDKIEANKKSAIVEQETDIVQQKATKIKMVKMEADSELKKALPTLEAAMKAVDKINSGDIAELKGMSKAPNSSVEKVFKCVMILVEKRTSVKNVEWKQIKQMMAVDFLNKLKAVNEIKDKLPSKCISALKNFLKAKKEKDKLNIEDIAKGARPAVSLFQWTTALIDYSGVVKKIEPLKKKAAELDAEFKSAEDTLNVQTQSLQVELDKVKALEDKFAEARREKQRLDDEVIQTQQRLERAEKLTQGLGGEHERWKTNIANLDDKIRKLVGDVFISAACISYYAPFTGKFRQNLVSKWLHKCEELGIPASEGITLENTMGNEVITQEWSMQGLPMDSVSVANGIIVDRGKRRPLMIDPQLQGTTWIKNMGESKSIQVARMNDKKILSTLEFAITQGYDLLIEDMPETIDPILEPILMNQMTEIGGRKQVKCGDQTIDYDENFRLFMTTKMTNPHFLPEVFIRVTVINFTVTENGLSEQLLSQIMQNENPQMEQQKKQLIIDIARDQKKMRKIEDEILESLANSNTNILDDKDLIVQLDDSKNVSDEVAITMVKNEEASTQIEETRSLYNPIAERAALLYFVIQDLAIIDPMYQYSLTYFIKLFKQILSKTEKSEEVKQRVKLLIKAVTETIYSNICRGLFNTHKLIFAFSIATKIQMKEEKISMQEWNIFLRGVVVDGDIKNIENPKPDVITAKAWRFILNLEPLHENFEGITEKMDQSIDDWSVWIRCKDPTQLPLPNGYDTKLSHFQRLLVYKALRQEKLGYLVKEFVENTMGRLFSNPMPANMDEVYQESDNRTPIIFILTAGADPQSQIERFAKKIKGEEDFDRFFSNRSLGQGQDEPALQSMKTGKEDGSWCLLQNCHLYKSFMPKLEEEILNNQDGKNDFNDDFRLFLTSMPCDYFPISILQNGIKITSEPAKGIKANLLTTFSQNTDEDIAGCKKPAEFKKLLFGISFFHAILQERRKFGPLGWNIRYDFNESDLDTAKENLKSMLGLVEVKKPTDSDGAESEDIDEDIEWNSLFFVTGEIIYGGRVTDNYDRRTLNNILDNFLNADIIEDDYKFSPSGRYYPPQSSDTCAEIITYIENLPDIDPPEIFGMNENADVAFQLQESTSMVETILSIQPRVGGAKGAKNPDDMVDEVAELIQEQMPPLLTKDGSSKELWKVNKENLMGSLSTYLLQEMERFNLLIELMVSSLGDLRKAIRGEVVMSDELDQMYKCLLNNKVPENWAAKAYPSLKPLMSWIENLKQRIEFFSQWLVNTRPKAFWLPSLFFPQGFLTALLQQYSRRHTIAIDELSFKFEFIDAYNYDDIEEASQDGAYIYGLFLECGLIDKNSLRLTEMEDGMKYSNFPIVLFQPERNHKTNKNDYSCPVYKTSERAGTLNTTGHSTNFIICIECESDHLPKHWVLQGTALLCQLDD